MGDRARATVVIATLLAMVGCGGAAGLADYEGERVERLKAIQSMPPAEQLPELRQRILDDTMSQHLLLFAARGSMAAYQAAASCMEKLDVKCTYLIAPMREELCEDYMVWADAMARAGDTEGAIAAYEDAITTADTLVFSRTAAARLRAKALRGEEQLWTARHEAARAAAAEAMARAEDAWVDTVEAKTADHEYDDMIAQSRGAMSQAVSEQSQAVFAALEAGLEVAQAGLQAAQAAHAGQPGAAGNAAAAALRPVVIAAAKRVATTMVSQISASSGLDLGPLKGIFGAVPGLLDAAKAGTMDAYAASEAGKKTLGDVMGAMEALRRGQSMERVNALVASASESARAIAGVAQVAQAAQTVEKVVEDVKTRLEKLQKLHADKLISDEEFERERQRILKEGL